MYSIQLTAPFQLESGEKIENLEIGFHIFGKLNPAKDNVVWVCHALTANSDVFSWWEGLFGKEKTFNPEEHFIVCVNSLGSCYGTTGPKSPQRNKRPSLDQFPLVTTRDMARVNEELRLILGIDKVSLLIGASLGGQQALEWSVNSPDVHEKIILMATNARHSAYGIAFNESQRLAIFSDSTYGNNQIEGGRQGLIAARSIAMLSYRTYQSYSKTQTNPGDHVTDAFLASSYQNYQGQKLADRFCAYSYVTLSRAMDAHNVGRNRESVEAALGSIKAQVLVIGIESDHLFPVEEQEFLAKHINNARYAEIQSEYGHDGFLIETDQIKELITHFLSDQVPENYSQVIHNNHTQFKLVK
ncbi:MAG: homoserine O-acetyltransferase [Fluviicola sp.]|nr:MAG: homoserine O-acetyltransferase [Fluviicola sp.]